MGEGTGFECRAGLEALHDLRFQLQWRRSGQGSPPASAVRIKQLCWPVQRQSTVVLWAAQLYSAAQRPLVSVPERVVPCLREVRLRSTLEPRHFLAAGCPVMPQTNLKKSARPLRD